MDFSKNQQFLQDYISVIEKVGIPTAKNPVFVIIRYGYVQPYVGSVQGIPQMIDYLKKEVLVKKIDTPHLRRQFMQNEMENRVFGYFKSFESKEYKEFAKAAHVMQDAAKFAATTNSKIAKAYNIIMNDVYIV